MEFICECGESFHATFYEFKKGKKQCNKCGRKIQGEKRRKNNLAKNGNLKETHPEIAEQWDCEKNGELKPEHVHAGSRDVVHWKCKKASDHIWIAKVCDRTGGRTNKRKPTGCPCCSKPIKKIVLSNCFATIYPEKLKLWHPTKNENINPFNLAPSSNEKFWWKCPVAEDHEWFVSINSLQGCPCCSGHKVVLSNCLATTHPEIAAQWHPTKNKLTPFEVSFGSDEEIWWQCPEETDHIWKSRVDAESDRKSLCPFCANSQVCKSNCLATTDPDIAAQWHPTKNGNLTPWDVTFGSDPIIWWKCKEGDDHIWPARIYTRRESGCPCCSKPPKQVAKSNCLATKFPNVAEEWDVTKNKDTPWDVTFASAKKRWFRCKKGHTYKTLICSRTNPSIYSGCPICRESKGEKAIRKHLEKHNVTHKGQWRFKKSKINNSQFDFAINHPEFTGVVEYQGSPHYLFASFGSKDKYGKELNLFNSIKRDHNKFQWCKKRNMPLLFIPYWDIKRIPEILDEVLAGRTPTFSEPPDIVKKHEPMRKAIRDRLGITEPEVLCGLVKNTPTTLPIVYLKQLGGN